MLLIQKYALAMVLCWNTFINHVLRTKWELMYVVLFLYVLLFQVPDCKECTQHSLVFYIKNKSCAFMQFFSYGCPSAFTRQSNIQHKQRRTGCFLGMTLTPGVWSIPFVAGIIHCACAFMCPVEIIRTLSLTSADLCSSILITAHPLFQGAHLILDSSSPQHPSILHHLLSTHDDAVVNLLRLWKRKNYCGCA